MRSILFLLLLSAATVAKGQHQYNFTHLGVENGLSHSWINSLYEDEFNMIWIGTPDGLNRFDGNKTTVFRPVSGDTTSIFSNNVKEICGDRKGKLYVLSKFALSEFDMRSEKFRTVVPDSIRAICMGQNNLWVCSANRVLSYNGESLSDYMEIPRKGRITSAFETSGGFLLVGTTDSGVYMIDKNRKMTILLPNNHIVSFFEDSKKNIWISTRYSGLYKISRDNHQTNYRYEKNSSLSLSDNYVRSVCEDDAGNYWIGTIKGVDILDPETNTIKPAHAPLSGSNTGSSPHPSVWCIIKDYQGSIWIGSFYGGINIYNQAKSYYRFHNKLFDDPKLAIIDDITGDVSGNLWIATEEVGLIRYNPDNQSVKTYSSANSPLPVNNLKSLYLDRDREILWIGTILGGLSRMETANGSIRVFRNDKSDPSSIPDNNIRKIVPYGKDSLILATYSAVRIFNTKDFRSKPLIKSTTAYDKYISDLIVDRSGNCWFAISNCVVRYNLKSGEIREYLKSGEQIGSFHVIALFEDRKGRIWLGSSGGGLFLFDSETETFKLFSSTNSELINDFILGIDESESGYLLLTTNGGFVRFDCENNTFYNYNKENGFPIGDLSNSGIHVISGSDIYVCGYRSLISFREGSISQVQLPANIYFTSLYVNNRRIVTGDETKILQRSLLYQKRIELENNHTVFSVEYASPGYTQTYNNAVEYRLEGFDGQWVRGNKGHLITYTNLAPGKYRLMIRYVDKELNSTLAPDALEIVVHPPFYRTPWFLMLLVISILCIGLWLLNIYTSRFRLMTTLNAEKKEKEAMQNLNQSKLRFFTYVSHELRTPLSLIQGNIESLMQMGTISPQVYAKISKVHNNLHKLNRLINELLDFKKQESDFNLMSFSSNNIVETIRGIYLSFKEYARTKNIEFTLGCGENYIELWYDPEQLEKVFNNLLSNAFKFTPEGGKISIDISSAGDRLIVSVADTGKGIPAKHIDSIFEPFHQVPDNGHVPGTGLGLTIARGIVNAHYGELTVASEEGGGTVFTVSLPLGKEHIPVKLLKTTFTDDQLCITADNVANEKIIGEIIESQHEAGSENATILIVEDNDELREFLVEIFSPVYNVLSASDGIQAWDEIARNQPDIILSDLMMPNMDGSELCKKVKNNIVTCHIPFVMLTAKITSDTALDVYRKGADDYIPKPFNAKILLTKCNNLVNSRTILQKKFARSTAIAPQMIATNSIDKQLIDKAIVIITENLANPEFDLLHFAREMAMGRTKLITKIKNLTGQTPNQFIINIRLKQSVAIMTENPDLPVNDVSFLVGFNSPSYFIKTFRSLYGMTPVAFRNNLKKNNDISREQGSAN